MNKLKGNKIIGNFFSLASVQMLIYILPLITLPYLAKVLSVSSLGLVSGSAIAYTNYFILFTDYGFNLIATRDISRVREDKEKVSLIFNSVMAAKLLLSLLAFIILVGLILVIPQLREHYMVYLLSFGMVIGNTLFPIWFFQGIEEMKVISLLNIATKLLFAFGIFIFIKSESDYLMYPILTSLGSILSGLIALGVVFFKYKITIKKPSFQQIKSQMKEGWDIFVSNMATSLYTQGNIIVLGFVASSEAVGYYALANQIIRACASAVDPLVRAVYPHISKQIVESKTEALKFIKKIWLLITVIIGAGCCILLFGTGILLPLIFGSKYNHSLLLIQIMAFIPLMVGWANMFGVITMINFGYQKQMSRIYLLAGVISIVSTAVLLPLFKEVGTAINIMFIETLITMLMFVFLKKQGIDIPRGKMVQEEGI